MAIDDWLLSMQLRRSMPRDMVAIATGGLLEAKSQALDETQASAGLWNGVRSDSRRGPHLADQHASSQWAAGRGKVLTAEQGGKRVGDGTALLDWAEVWPKILEGGADDILWRVVLEVHPGSCSKQDGGGRDAPVVAQCGRAINAGACASRSRRVDPVNTFGRAACAFANWCSARRILGLRLSLKARRIGGPANVPGPRLYDAIRTGHRFAPAELAHHHHFQHLASARDFANVLRRKCDPPACISPPQLHNKKNKKNSPSAPALPIRRRCYMTLSSIFQGY